MARSRALRAALVAIALLAGVLPAQGWNAKWTFDDWPVSTYDDDCHWDTVNDGGGPAYCRNNGIGLGTLVGLGETGRSDALDVVNGSGCYSGNCLYADYSSPEQRYFLLPNVQALTGQGTMPHSDGGCLSCVFRLGAGWVPPSNSLKTWRAYNSDEGEKLIGYTNRSGFNAMDNYVGTSPTTSCRVDYDIHVQNVGRAHRIDVCLSYSTTTMKQWVKVLEGPQAGQEFSCVNSNMNFFEAGSSSYENVHIMGNISKLNTEPDSIAIGGDFYIDEVCAAEFESSRDPGGFCETGTPVDQCDTAADCFPVACQVAACTLGTPNVCTYSDVSNGTSCDDSNACTETTVCTDGFCGGGEYTCGAHNLDEDFAGWADVCDTADTTPDASCGNTRTQGAHSLASGAACASDSCVQFNWDTPTGEGRHSVDNAGGLQATPVGTTSAPGVHHGYYDLCIPAGTSLPALWNLAKFSNLQEVNSGLEEAAFFAGSTLFVANQSTTLDPSGWPGSCHRIAINFNAGANTLRLRVFDDQLTELADVSDTSLGTASVASSWSWVLTPGGTWDGGLSSDNFYTIDNVCFNVDPTKCNPTNAVPPEAPGLAGVSGSWSTGSQP